MLLYGPTHLVPAQEVAATTSTASSAGQIYWDYPKVLVPEGVNFPQPAAGGGIMAVVWQEYAGAANGGRQVSLSILVTRDGKDWTSHRDFAGPFPASGRQVSIFSLAIDQSGRIYVAVNAAPNEVAIYSSSDGGSTFTELSRVTAETTTVGPRLFVRGGGGLILFTAQGGQTVGGLNALSIRYLLSADGRNWTSARALVTSPDLSLNFAPYYAFYRGRDNVVFQVLRPGTPAAYHLYLEQSSDGGETFGPPKRLVGFQQGGAAGGANPLFYSDERPFLLGYDGKLSVVWERTYQTGTPQVYYAQYDLDGNLTGDVERVSSGDSTSRDPRIAIYGDREYVFWFDNSVGTDHVFAASYNGVFWQRTDLSAIAGSSIFARPLLFGDGIYVFWFNEVGDTGRLVMLPQNRSAPAPRLYGINFRAGGRTNLSSYLFGWEQPADPSGVAGFSFSVNRDPVGQAPREINILPNDRRTQVKVDADGEWYIHLATEDFAGNWSETSTIAFTRDTTPPGPVAFTPIAEDGKGFLTSNTATIRWKAPPDRDLAGYTYSFNYLSADPTAAVPAKRSLLRPPDAVRLSAPDFAFTNEDNGVWALSVAAVDQVGNVGPATTLVLRLDKYRPVTYITDVQSTQDSLGRVTLTIYGRGFAEGGKINEVILDRDGKEPYDYVFPAASRQFTVESDRIIRGPTIEDVRQGTYRVGLISPSRGLYFTAPLLTLSPTGTVKFGYYGLKQPQLWRPIEVPAILLSVNSIVILLVLGFLAAMLLVSVYRIGRIVEEGRVLNLEVRALLAGTRISPVEKKERLAQMKKIGMGLRAKFVLLITLLVIIVVLMVSTPLGYFMITTQQRNLAQGLLQQTQVLMDSLATGARTYLPDKNIIELGALPDLRVAMSEAQFVTITGYGATDDKHYDYVWASDDPQILKKLDTQVLNPGFSRIHDDITPKVPAIKESIDSRATKEVSGLSQELQKLGAQAAILATKDDPKSIAELARYQQEITALNKEVNAKLFEIGNVIGSVPAYEVNNLSRAIDHYTFFKPIVYRSNQDSLYFRGMIRMGVSTEPILKEMKSSERTLLITSGVVALVAIGLGVLGALLLAYLTVIPINRLVRGVEIIRDTEDKEKLKDHVIDVKTRDELSRLAETVNEMTRGLVAAAAANKDLVLGKDTQKMFTPLEQDPVTNRKLTTARETNNGAEFFGYYEGAKGVSGDYFDYRKLDERHYAIIECDVAGKGVPASLIMVEVATIFIDYFRNWDLAREGIHLERLVYRINDLVEERGFKGRFAALLVVIFDSVTGDCYFCNAGYKYVHLFDTRQGQMAEITLPNAPAAGVFPSSLVEMQSGFKQVRHKLSPGDCLLLFTDGVEEAKRHFRDRSLSVVACGEPGLKPGEVHGTHPFGSDNEELGIARIHAIIEAVMARGRFELRKYHNAIAEEALSFDFSECRGTVEEAVLAMVSVERVFRLYPDPHAGPDDRIMVDRKIADFLRGHFVQYSLYFREATPHPTLPEYVYFSHLKEDEQYDDLTILGVRKR